jgi:hypothetical protein
VKTRDGEGWWEVMPSPSSDDGNENGDEVAIVMFRRDERSLNSK